MSVKEARKLLGKTAAKMTGEQIKKLVRDLDEIARLTFEQWRREHCGFSTLPTSVPTVL